MFKCCTKAQSEDSEENAGPPLPESVPPVNPPSQQSVTEPPRKPSILRKKTSFCEENKVFFIDREEVEKEEEVEGRKTPQDLTVDCDLANRALDPDVEPPRTPVGKDELALRRHRFFSELLTAAQAAVEHKVRFDPLGPENADLGTPLLLYTVRHVLVHLSVPSHS